MSDSSSDSYSSDDMECKDPYQLLSKYTFKTEPSSHDISSGIPGPQGPRGLRGLKGDTGLTGLNPNHNIISGFFDFDSFPQIKSKFSVSNPIKNKYNIEYLEPFDTTPSPFITIEQKDSGTTSEYITYNITKNGFVIEFLPGSNPFKVHFLVNTQL